MSKPNDRANILDFADPQGEYERLIGVLEDIAGGEVDYVMREEWQSLAEWMADKAREALGG